MLYKSEFCIIQCRSNNRFFYRYSKKGFVQTSLGIIPALRYSFRMNNHSLAKDYWNLCSKGYKPCIVVFSLEGQTRIVYNPEFVSMF